MYHRQRCVVTKHLGVANAQAFNCRGCFPHAGDVLVTPTRLSPGPNEAKRHRVKAGKDERTFASQPQPPPSAWQPQSTPVPPGPRPSRSPRSAPSKPGTLGRPSSSQPGVVDEAGAGGAVTVYFRLRYQTSWGQTVKVIGSHAKLGNWSLEGAVELHWQAGDVWCATVTVPANLGVLEYKYVLVDYQTKRPVAWQQGGNSVLAIKPGEFTVEVQDNWGNSPGSLVKSDEGTSTRELKLQAWASEMMSYRSEARVARMESNELRAEAAELRAEMTRLQSELHQSQAANMSNGMRIAELQQEKVLLNTQLTNMENEMCATLRIAIDVMRQGEDDDDEGDDGGDGDGTGEDDVDDSTSSNSNSNNGSSSSIGSVDAVPATVGQRLEFAAGGTQATGNVASSPAASYQHINAGSASTGDAARSQPIFPTGDAGCIGFLPASQHQTRTMPPSQGQQQHTSVHQAQHRGGCIQLAVAPVSTQAQQQAQGQHQGGEWALMPWAAPWLGLLAACVSSGSGTTGWPGHLPATRTAPIALAC